MALPDYEAMRRRMVEQQIAARGIDDPRLLDAFRTVPREMFVAPEYQASAYSDGPLPIAAGQTISQPYIVALMIAAAEVGPEDNVLEVGAGSGYAAAILGKVARVVIAIERHPTLAEEARERIAALGLANVTIVDADGTRGWPENAPFDAILVAAAADRVPQPLLDQLQNPGGRLAIPVGGQGWSQSLIKVVRNGAEEYQTTDLGGVRFVPLISDD
ncbi:MAG: protein-L-isoaspartate(D-aspartate) O-methyltransferase [Sphingomicrobium sp.]